MPLGQCITSGLELWVAMQDLDLMQICNFGTAGLRAVAGLTTLTSLALAGCKLDRDEERRHIEEIVHGYPAGTAFLRQEAIAQLFVQLTGLA